MIETEQAVKLVTDHTYGTWRPQRGWKKPLFITRAEGVRFYDDQGRSYLDLSSQLMCSNLGHGNRAVIEALKEQAERLPYVAPSFACEAKARAVEALLEVMPQGLDQFFFSTSGTEANEAALKIIRQYMEPQRRYKIISRYHSYHGSTPGSIALTGDPRRWFAEPVNKIPGVIFAPDAYCYRCPFGLEYPQCNLQCAEYVDYMIKEEGNVAAIFVEPVVGTNGVIVPPQEYLPRLREIADEHGVLFVVDEVMSGWHRTGRWFAIEHWGVKPDILTTAKGCTGAYAPVGVTVTTAKIRDYFEERFFLSTREEVEEAIGAAREAFPEWRETPPVTRVQYLFRLKELLEEHFEELARTLVGEEGKTLDEARGEMRRLIENVEVATGIPSLMMGYNLEDIARGIDEEVIRQPLGVFATIPPFNFPAMVPWWFAPYAIATGNTYIIKPSEQVPLIQNKIFELLDELDLPPGVINLVNGAKDVVDLLLESPDIIGISSVTSTPVARYIYSKAVEQGKRVQCQAGAKNFIVVMPDANLERTVPALLTSFFGCAGERCLAGSVLVAVGDIYEPLKKRFVEAAARIKVGDPLDETMQMGPVISKKHKERVLGYIEQGLKEGAELLLDGRDIDVGLTGYFIGPTVFDRVTPEMGIAQEEIFGPVVSILKVKDLDEAIEIIQANPYGNASSIFTSSGHLAREFKYRVKCGNIGINIGIVAPMAFFPFGGRKDSFFGDLHGQGRDAIDFFTEKKVVITRWW